MASYRFLYFFREALKNIRHSALLTAVSICTLAVSLIMLGFFGWSGHQLLTRAHNLAPASMLAPFGYSFILFLTLWSYAVFDHLPDKWTVMGAVIIVVSGLIIWFRELVRSRYKDVQTTGL